MNSQLARALALSPKACAVFDVCISSTFRMGGSHRCLLSVKLLIPDPYHICCEPMAVVGQHWKLYAGISLVIWAAGLQVRESSLALCGEHKDYAQDLRRTAAGAHVEVAAEA